MPLRLLKRSHLRKRPLTQSAFWLSSGFRQHYLKVAKEPVWNWLLSMVEWHFPTRLITQRLHVRFTQLLRVTEGPALVQHIKRKTL